MGDIKALLDMAKSLEIEADETQAKRLLGGKMTIKGDSILKWKMLIRWDLETL